MDASEDDYVLAGGESPVLVCPAPPPVLPRRESTRLPAFLELHPAFGKFISATRCGGSPEADLILEHSLAPARRVKGSPLQDGGPRWTGGAPIGSRLAQFVPGRLEVGASVLIARGCGGQVKEGGKRASLLRKVEVVARTLGSTRVE